jgi:hypothetical protein
MVELERSEMLVVAAELASPARFERQRFLSIAPASENRL